MRRHLRWRSFFAASCVVSLVACSASNGADGESGRDGAQGPIGQVGPTGPAGEDGAPGIPGPPGTDGTDGAAGEMAPEVWFVHTPTDPSGPAASFEFACNVTTCEFKCSLDSGSWASCASPCLITGLDAGPHHFEVRAAAGAAVSEEEAFFWTVAPASLRMNVILIVGDGMQLAHEIAASRYLYGQDRGLVFHQFPYQGAATTWDVDTYDRYAWKLGLSPFDPQAFDPSVGYDPMLGGRRAYPDEYPSWADSYFLTPLRSHGATSEEVPATDSASAATALATGRKTTNGNIAWAADDGPHGALTTIAELARSGKGASIGVVSTVPFNHATPASFVAHNTSRNNLYTGYKGYSGVGIADEIVEVTQPEVVIGGGHPMLDNPQFDTTKGYLSESLLVKLRNGNEHILVERAAGVDASAVLREKTTAAMQQSKRLFALYGGVGGNFESPVPVDAPGAPEVLRATTENPTLAEATMQALRVLSTNPNGFFLVVEQGDIDWANHANDYGRMIGTMWDLENAVKAAVGFVSSTGDDVDWSNTLLIVTSDHGNSYMHIHDKLGPGDLPRQEKDAAGRFVYPDGEVTYGTTGHTNELVSVYAIGAGADGFELFEGVQHPGTKLVDNTHIHRVMRNVLGI